MTRPGQVDSPAPTASPVVGVALPVPEPWGGYLQQLRVAYGEDRAQHIPTHITLMPPTPVAADQVEPLRRHLAEVAAGHARFEVLLRGTGTFRPVSDVVYVQVAQGVSSCERLERAVRGGPVSRDLEFPYHPHVTVAHDRPGHVLDRAFSDLEAFTCAFTAAAFRLYLHTGDGVWRVEEEFTLSE
ncbi:2'-5' RNA ligase family protein [Ornithinimicrobium pekingense]|uniref:2'-5' RNA ligase family protein n=1 Tax=Ornithinimicrobium pekingense TaxID=384677 RepID=UPI0003FCE7B0|nr:2'-5' RNA ligase family protein [Ornithinimicrobium pekingense]